MGSLVNHKRWWHSLMLSVTVVTWGLSQPLYGFIIGNDFFERSTGQSILLLMLLYQALPVLALFVFDRLMVRHLTAEIFVRFARSLFFLAAFLVYLREIQLNWDSPVVNWTNSPSTAWAAILAAAVIPILTFALIRWHRAMFLTAMYLSVVSLILTGIFTVQSGLLGSAWEGDSDNISDASLPSGSNASPVFIIVFDGLGAFPILNEEYIDETRFPSFAELGSESVVFTNATANYFSSSISIGSMMTGEFFSDNNGFHRDPSASDSEDDLLTTLLDTERSVEFYSNHFGCADEKFTCLDVLPKTGPNIHRVARDFAVWFLPRKLTRFGRNLIVNVLPAEVTLRIPFDPIHSDSKSMWELFISRISGMDSPGKAHFVHIMLPHQPYEFNPDGVRIREVSAVQGFGDFKRMAMDYSEQVMFVDKLLGKFIAKLKSEGLYDRSLIIVTGDHGPRSLGLGHQYSGFDKYDDFPLNLSAIIPKVPLFIHGEGISPQVSSANYQHIDLLPTVLDILNLPDRQHLPGVSAFSPLRAPQEKVFYGVPNDEGSGIAVYDYLRDKDIWTRSDNR